MIDQEASDQKQKSLPYISEHYAEDERVGQPDKYRGIHLVVSRKAVHLDKHFKGFEKFRVFQFCRRFAEVGVMVVLHNDKYFIVILDLFKEFFHVVVGHPAAQDVVVFLVVFHPCCQFTDIKVIGQFFQPVFRGYKLRSPVGEHLSGFLVQIFNLQINPGNFPFQRLVSIGRRSLKLVFQLNPFKMKGPEDRVNFLCLAR